MNKSDQHAAIRQRAAAALRAMYHNATPSYPCLNDRDSKLFDEWFPDAATQEIEYIADGGAYSGDYRKTLEHPANAGKLKSERARRYYVAKGLREQAEDRATNAWERISEFGKLYTWGRGGRTLAPDGLIGNGPYGGGSFVIKHDYADDLPIGRVVELIAIVESFNRAVGEWCRSVPEMWKEYYAEEYGGADVETVAELSTTE